VSYAAKFGVKTLAARASRSRLWKVCGWAEDLRTFLIGDKSEWDWIMMIRQPDAATADQLAHLADEVTNKKSMPVAKELSLISFEEGTAAQVLHVGPCTTEASRSCAARVHPRAGVHFDGHRQHHEIYLGEHAGQLRRSCAR